MSFFDFPPTFAFFLLPSKVYILKKISAVFKFKVLYSIMGAYISELRMTSTRI